VDPHIVVAVVEAEAEVVVEEVVEEAGKTEERQLKIKGKVMS
jgi:hypothetical protein